MIQEYLVEDELVPGQHLVDAGDVSAKLINNIELTLNRAFVTSKSG